MNYLILVFCLFSSSFLFIDTCTFKKNGRCVIIPKPLPIAEGYKYRPIIEYFYNLISNDSKFAYVLNITKVETYKTDKKSKYGENSRDIRFVLAITDCDKKLVFENSRPAQTCF